ncbi:hypothetical protein Efla_005636 [Eimeria flavescens]
MTKVSAKQAIAEEVGEEAAFCRSRRDYSALPFIVFSRRLRGPSKRSRCEAADRRSVAPSSSACCCGQARASSLDRTLLLLPVCAACAAAPPCGGGSALAAAAGGGSSRDDLVDSCGRSSGGVEAVRASCCVCNDCASSLLLLLLLRLGLNGLADSAATGVLLCGCDDVPSKQADFFPLLLRGEDEGRPGAPPHAEGVPQELSLASQTNAFSLLRRIGFKLLPGPRSSSLPSRHEGSAACSSPLASQLPPLLRVMAELPEALHQRPPALLLMLRPSRWLHPGRQQLEPAAAPTALQQLTDLKSYGLFLALLLRSVAPRPPCEASSGGGAAAESRHAAGCEAASGLDMQRTAAAAAAAAECFLGCTSCCFRCSRALRVTRSGRVSLCCLEQSDWLCMLRSRFSRILLLFCGLAEAFSAGSGGPALFVADVTDVASDWPGNNA